MNISPDQARAELARRELARRQQQQQVESPEENENLLQKIVKYGLKDPAIGGLKYGRELANIPNKLSGGKIPEFSPSDFNFSKELGVDKPNALDTAIQFGGQYVPSFLLPEAKLGKLGEILESVPKIGSVASKVISQALPQGLYGASQAPNESLKTGAETAAYTVPGTMLAQLMQNTNPLLRAGARAASALASAYLGREGAKAVGVSDIGADVIAAITGGLGARGFNTRKQMMQKLTEGVNKDLATERLKQAEKLGLDYLTPAEAGVSPWAAKQQGKLGKTEEGGKMIYDRSMARQESERTAINKTLDMIYNESEMQPKISQGYKGMSSVNLPPEFPLQFKDNAIIEHAQEIVKNNPVYQESLKKMLPENAKLQPGQKNPMPTSLVYWDHVKRALDDMAEKATSNESRIISNTRGEMRDQMDAHYPEYANARSLYERKKVREGLEKVFDQKEVNGQNFYRALASQNKFDEILGHLKNAPEAAENLKAMRSLFKDIMGPPTIKTAKGIEERGMSQSRSTGAFLENLMEHVFTGGINDKKAIEFITSKDWLNQMNQIEKISDKHMKMIALGMALSKGVAQYAGSQ